MKTSFRTDGLWSFLIEYAKTVVEIEDTNWRLLYICLTISLSMHIVLLLSILFNVVKYVIIGKKFRLLPISLFYANVTCLVILRIVITVVQIRQAALLAE